MEDLKNLGWGRTDLKLGDEVREVGDESILVI